MNPKQIPDPLWTAQMLPVAPYTRSVHINLPWHQQESGRYPIQWNWPVDIVGMLFTVINTTENGQGQTFRVPLVSDFVCQLQVSNEKQYTSANDNSDFAAFADFCDLRALDVTNGPQGGNRSTRIVIAGPGELGINVRWKVPQLAQITLNAGITASVYYRRVTPEQARAAIDEMTAYSR